MWIPRTENLYFHTEQTDAYELYILFELRSPSSRPPTPGVVMVIVLHKPFNNRVERLVKQNSGQLLILVFGNLLP